MCMTGSKTADTRVKQFSSTALSHTCYGTPMPATLNQLLDGNFEASVDAFFCRITHWHATVAFDVDHEELIQNNAAAYRFMLRYLTAACSRCNFN